MANIAQVNQQITESIIADLENGVMPWQCPWNRDGAGDLFPVNYKTKKHYNGINAVWLWTQANKQQFSSNAWLTFKQAKEIGGNVRKGSKATSGIFYRVFEKENKETGKLESIPVASAFNVFNLDQIDGIVKDELPAPDEFLPNERAQQLLNDSGAVINETGMRAYYSASHDYICLPERGRFSSADNFYATAAHELVHWTGHSSRINRDFSGRFGDSAYAFEELTAELGSAFLGARLGLTGVYEGHASYIGSWIKVLQNDHKAILKASSEAQKAFDFLLNTSSQENSDD